MGSGDDHTRPKPIGDFRIHVREYAVRAVKAYLCVACWAGIVAVLLTYGPPAMTVSTASESLHASEAVDAGFAILLSAGTATFLTIILVVGVLTYLDRQHAQSTDQHQHQQHEKTTDNTEDETHA